MHYAGSYDDLPKTVKTAVKDLKPRFLAREFDAIICQGISGLLVASPLALGLQCDLVVVRKPDEKSHGVPGEMQGFKTEKHKRLLFVDDFISRGDTVARCETAVVTATERAEEHGMTSERSRITASYEYQNFGGSNPKKYNLRKQKA